MLNVNPYTGGQHTALTLVVSVVPLTLLWEPQMLVISEREPFWYLRKWTALHWMRIRNDGWEPMLHDRVLAIRVIYNYPKGPLY